MARICLQNKLHMAAYTVRTCIQVGKNTASYPMYVPATGSRTGAGDPSKGLEMYDGGLLLPSGLAGAGTSGTYRGKYVPSKWPPLTPPAPVVVLSAVPLVG
jgi:hypothetical protein